MHEIHYPLPASIEAMCRKKSNACCPRHCNAVLKEFFCYWPVVAWQCIARVPLPAAPRHKGTMLQGFQCPLPLSSIAQGA